MLSREQMLSINPAAYSKFGESLGRVADEWDRNEHTYKRNPGSADRHHEMVKLATGFAIDADGTLPIEWKESSALSDGMGVFSAISYMKSAVAGYNGMPRKELDKYVMSNDGMWYAARLATGPSLVAGRTELDLGLSAHQYSYPEEYLVKEGIIKLEENKLAVPNFVNIRNVHVRSAEEKKLDMGVRCQAIIHKAFPTTYRAVNVLSVNSGISSETYERFKNLRR